MHMTIMISMSFGIYFTLSVNVDNGTAFNMTILVNINILI